MHQPANSYENAPVLDFFRTIDSSSHLNSIPTYLATRLRTYEQLHGLSRVKLRFLDLTQPFSPLKRVSHPAEYVRGLFEAEYAEAMSYEGHD